MKFSELKGRAVVNLEDASKIGEVQDLMIEPGSRRIVSLRVKTGMFSSARLVPATDVKNVGADAVTVSLTAGQGSQAGATLGQQGNVNGSPEAGQALVKLTGILGNKVVTDAGTFLGELHDILLDWSDLTITGYEARESGLFAKTQVFAATPDVSFGEKMITIPALLLNQPK